MRGPVLRLLACAVVVAAAGAAQGVRPASAALVPDPDTAYCAPTFVQGTATYTPPMTSAPLTRAESMTVQAQCTGAGDEAGTYSLTLSGTTTGDCGGGIGSGTVTGSTPEGTMTGTYTYAKPGIHYYINGSYMAAGESHTMQLWLDATPVLDPNQICFYSVATLIGHGAFIDVPQGDGSDTVDFTATTTSLTPPVGAVGGTGSYTFASSACEMVSAPEVGACTLVSSGTYSNIVCGTGTWSGTANLNGPDGSESMSYTITFEDGTGELTGSMNANDGPATVTGIVDLTPSGGNCVNGTTQFTIVGHLTITP